MKKCEEARVPLALVDSQIDKLVPTRIVILVNPRSSLPLAKKVLQFPLLVFITCKSASFQNGGRLASARPGPGQSWAKVRGLFVRIINYSQQRKGEGFQVRQISFLNRINLRADLLS